MEHAMIYNTTKTANETKTDVDSRVPVASLGWVTPGAATDGVTPLFFPENLATFFAHRCHYHYRFLCFHSGVTPPGCHPTPFLPVRPRFSTILCKFAHIFSFGCHPLEGVTRGGPPPSDATARHTELANGLHISL